MQDTLTRCYHCGEEVPPGIKLEIDICGKSQSMCCPGCQAVAGLITSGGMESFYRQRTAFNIRPEFTDSSIDQNSTEQFSIYDDPLLAAAFTETMDSGLYQSQLLLNGINCAACTWLIEQSLLAQNGVKKVSVQLAQSRLDIEYDPEEIRLSEIFQRVEALGYKARPFKASAQREQMAQNYKSALRHLAVAGLGMMQVGMFAIALHAGDIQGIEHEYQALLRWVSLLVSSFIVLYCAKSFFVSAWRHLKIGALVMDLPVALAIGLAWLASAWATVTGTGQVYFDSVVMFTFFLLLARYLEMRARLSNVTVWVDIEDSLPAVVTAYRESRWQNIRRQEVSPGETVLLRSGETIPVDAQVIKGSSAVVESAFNGEELPRRIDVGDTLYAGTLNVEATIEATALCSYGDSRLALLQRSIEVGETEKPDLAKLADRVAAVFIAFILIVTSITAVIWLVVDPTRALWVSLSVLVISCPCALALATPAALTAAANSLRSRGVIVRGENALESLSHISHLIFDKTGTLTEGKLAVEQVVLLAEHTEEEVLAIAATMQRQATHPIAQAFSKITTAVDFDEIKYEVGKGLVGLRGSERYYLGSQRYIQEIAETLPCPPKQALYWIALSKASVPIAWIGLSDKPRKEAKHVIGLATELGLKVELLTGDSSDQGSSLASQLGIPTINIGMEPAQKMEYVQQLQQSGAIVAMVGDGLNDAPVLSVANTSFAVADATDLAKTKADFVFVEGDLYAVIATLKKARQCRRIIIQNFSWAVAYNLVAIPLATLGFVAPWAAAIGMSFSSLLVVLNSLRLNN